LELLLRLALAFQCRLSTLLLLAVVVAVWAKAMLLVREMVVEVELVVT
jgi:hypothetical protein